MPTLDTYRKQAKLLLRRHRDGDYAIGEKLRRLERYNALTDCEALALKFTLTLAQEIVAVEAGHGSWSELKAARADTLKTPRPSRGLPILRNVVLILFVRDVKASAAFFREKLGSERTFSMARRRSAARRRVTGYACIFAACASRHSRNWPPRRSR